MISISAVNRTVILLAAILIMSAVWGFFRIPDANMLIVTFTFLTATFPVVNPSFRNRLKMACIIACYSATIQFLISVLYDMPLMQIIVSSLFAYAAFSTLPDFRAGCIVMITGYLAFFAPHGFLPAAARCIDIITGIPVIMAVTSLCRSNNSGIKYSVCSGKKSFMLAAALGTGNFIARILQLRQGAWIMLTILFITMSETPEISEEKLALQRIFAVPTGIILGGAMLETFCRIDYNLVYLVPFIGAVGFFLLYNYGNFFLFSLFFMITLTIFSDWMTGPYHRFNFSDILVSRTIASFIGAIIIMIFNISSTSSARRMV